MERLDPDLRQAALTKARANRGISDLAGAVLAAAEACRTRESWDQELRLLLESWGFRSQLGQEVSEPED